jgi:hypothetical protein
MRPHPVHQGGEVDYTDYMTFAAISLISDLSFEPL